MSQTLISGPGSSEASSRDLPGTLRRALVPAPVGRSLLEGAVTAVLLIAAALVAASAIVHLRLWSNGYRSIPTIGALFMFQGVASLVVAVALAVLRRAWMVVASLAMMVGTIGGFFLSVNVGLFGFQDSLSAPDASLALGIELAATAMLVAGGALLLGRRYLARS